MTVQVPEAAAVATVGAAAVADPTLAVGGPKPAVGLTRTESPSCIEQTLERNLSESYSKEYTLELHIKILVNRK